MNIYLAEHVVDISYITITRMRRSVSIIIVSICWVVSL